MAVSDVMPTWADEFGDGVERCAGQAVHEVEELDAAPTVVVAAAHLAGDDVCISSNLI
jgi:hypothetical protein